MQRTFYLQMKSPVSITLIVLSVVLLTSAYQFIYSHYYHLPMIFIGQKLDEQADVHTVIKAYKTLPGNKFYRTEEIAGRAMFESDEQ